MEPKKYRVRPIQKSDLPTLCEIATKVGPGFTSLPHDPSVIENKINRSLKSFALEIPARSRFFLFVLEELASQIVVGTAAIETCLGHDTPYYCFEVSTLIQQHTALNIRKEHQLLSLTNNYQEASIFGTLYVDPRHRGQSQGAFLSRARALFVSAFPDLFSEIFIAQLRGYFNEQGESLFWTEIGQHFFDLPFQTANHQLATQGSQFITDLAPSHPIYISLLAKPVQETIGLIHPQTLPAEHVLKKEGFVFRNNVDVLDAGPVLEAYKKNLKTVKEAREATVAGIKNTLSADTKQYLISTVAINFNAILDSIELKNAEEVYIETETAAALKLDTGDKLRFCPFR